LKEEVRKIERDKKDERKDNKDQDKDASKYLRNTLLKFLENPDLRVSFLSLSFQVRGVACFFSSNVHFSLFLPLETTCACDWNFDEFFIPGNGADQGTESKRILLLLLD